MATTVRMKRIVVQICETFKRKCISFSSLLRSEALIYLSIPLCHHRRYKLDKLIATKRRKKGAEKKREKFLCTIDGWPMKFPVSNESNDYAIMRKHRICTRFVLLRSTLIEDRLEKEKNLCAHCLGKHVDNFKYGEREKMK